MKNNEGNTVEEVKHHWWKELENALNVRETTDDRNDMDDDVLEMTQVERNAVCPIGRKEMVKNILCGSMEYFEEQHRGIKGGNLSMLGLYDYVLVPLDPYDSGGFEEDYVWLYLLQYNQEQRFDQDHFGQLPH